MEKIIEKILINTEKTFLTSECSAYKTEAFIRATRKISHVDSFISKIAEGLWQNSFPFSSLYENHNSDVSVMAETEDKMFTVFFRFGLSLNNPSVGKKDVVFYKFLSKDKSERKNDRQIINYLERNKKFFATFRTVEDTPNVSDFSKIYLLSDDDRVNFPLLNKVQREIVETEDKNILVQGVAGSGKTNVCIDKIIYCACRNYYGKILYTTYSRGLLIETKNRVEVLKENLKKFILNAEKGNVVFLDRNHKKALENKLGIYFNVDDDDKIFDKVKRIIDYLDKKVDYYLIEDLYSEHVSKNFSVFNEKRFIKEYVGEIKNYRLSGTLEKLKTLSLEVIYKEIFGMIYGRYEPDSPKPMMTREEYIAERADCFTKNESDSIYSLALDYGKFLEKYNFIDNNSASRALISKIKTPLYSVAVVDEVQDFTQVNLNLIKQISLKLCCVGDALQMINPSYFSFGYLKRIMYGGDKTTVTELKHNYRNSEQIEKIVESLGELNIKQFGTHSFVLTGESVENNLPTATVFVNGDTFLSELSKHKFDSATIIVSSYERKESLRKIFKHTEILTVSEAKGLERNTVILTDVLSDNVDKWRALQNLTVNRKTADENSVYRYYFNLFYVGVSRAQQYLFVTERAQIPLFKNLFENTLEQADETKAIKLLSEIADKIELDDDELVARIQQFIGLEQYENALFTADKISDDTIRIAEIQRIEVAKKFVRFGKYREAGVEYWKRNMIDDARKMFRMSNDEKLIELMDASLGKGNKLDVNIVSFYPFVADNDVAREIILDTVKSDYNELLGAQRKINETLKTKKRSK